jgi:DNA-binding LacI/PurR family transcriptional regulator
VRSPEHDMPVRLKDIAKRANVSVQVVSAVLHNTSTTTSASPDTRKRILRVAREVGYVPHASASSLARGRSNAIGFICHWLPQAHYSRALALAEELCSNHHHSLLISRTQNAPDWASLLKSGQVDLLLTVGLGDLNLAGLTIPPSLQSRIVAVGAIYDGVERDRQWQVQLTWDNQAVGVTAARHLLEQGCRHPVMLAGPQQSADKSPGFMQTLQQAGLKPILLSHEEPAERSVIGYRLTRQLIQQHPKTDGIFLFADTLYPGVARAMIESQWPAAAKVKVVGYGGDYEAIDSVVPPLQDCIRTVLEAYFAGSLGELPDTHLPSLVKRAVR